jgi:hypothetical protein
MISFKMQITHNINNDFRKLLGFTQLLGNIITFVSVTDGEWERDNTQQSATKKYVSSSG